MVTVVTFPELSHILTPQRTSRMNTIHEDDGIRLPVLLRSFFCRASMVNRVLYCNDGKANCISSKHFAVSQHPQSVVKVLF